MKRASSLLRILNILTLVGMVALAVTGLVYFFVPGLDSAIAAILLSTGLGIAALNVVAMLFLRSKSELETVRKINTNNFENKLIELKQQKAGILTYDKRGKIIHLTDWLISAGFKNVLGKHLDVLEVDTETSRIQEIVRGNKTFRIQVDEKKNVIHIQDNTELAKFREILIAKQHAVLILDIKYSNKLKFNNAEFSKVQAQIMRIINEFAKRVGGTVSTLANSEEIIISTDWGSLNTFFGTEKSNFFKQFARLKENRKQVIVTGGVATANASIAKLTDEARIGLRTATNKGGNLVVVDIAGETKIVGKSAIGFTEKTSTELNFLRQVIDEKIKNAKNVIITTHSYSDADAAGSALAMAQYVENLRKKPYVVLETMDKTTKGIIEMYGKNFEQLIITSKEVASLISNNTVLIVTDTSDPNRIQLDKEVLKTIPAENRIIIDHHRISGDKAIETDADSILLDTNKSSASEIAAELLYFQAAGSENALRDSLETLLFLGIYIDTNGWQKNTGSGTFDVASWLIKSGADTANAASYIELPRNMISQFQGLFENTTIYKDEYAFATLPEEVKYDDEVISIFANKLLEFEGTNASFVIGINKSKRLKVSARSNENINVQAIMEEIGGGGHFDMAAASYDSKRKTSILVEKIKKAIEKLN